MMLVALVLTASTVSAITEHTVMIAKDKNGVVTILIDHKPATCADVDKFYKSQVKGHAKVADCKRLGIIENVKR
jgi:hypothetical protein